MIRIEGYISKRNIRRWLENYEALAAGDRSPDAVPSNSGPKAYDGVSGARINLIMLNQALDQLRQEKPKTYCCVKARWLMQLRTVDALRQLGIDRGEYTGRCNAAVDFIFERVNGEAGGRAAGYYKLLEAVANLK